MIWVNIKEGQNLNDFDQNTNCTLLGDTFSTSKPHNPMLFSPSKIHVQEGESKWFLESLKFSHLFKVY